MGQGYTINFLKKRVVEMKKIMEEGKKMGNFKKESMGGLCTRLAAGGRCIISSMWLFLCALSKVCTTQEVVDPTVCMPRGCSIAFVSKKILTFGFWRAVFEKETKKFTVASSPWGNGSRTVKGRVRDLATSLVFIPGKQAYIHYLCHSVPRNIPVNYSLIIFALWPP